MSLQLSSSDAPNATTHSGNTARLYDFDSIKAKVFNTVLDLRKRGYAEYTLRNFLNILLRMARIVNLDDVESVREYIAEKQCAESFKRNLVDAYNHYVVFNSLSWNKPHYQKVSKLPIVPTEERLNIIIGHAGKKYSLGFWKMRRG